MLQPKEVAMAQPINQLPENEDHWPFFAFDSLYYYWELYTVAVQELVFTMITGVAAVTLVAFLMMPHWTAALHRRAGAWGALPADLSRGPACGKR